MSQTAVRVLARIAGRDRAPRLPSAQVVQAFTQVTSRLSEPEAGRIAGVSAATIVRWRRGGVRRLRKRIRRRLLDFLAEREEGGRSEAGR